MRRPAAYGITGTLLGLLLGAAFGFASFVAWVSMVDRYELEHLGQHWPLITLSVACAAGGLIVMVWAIICAVRLGRWVGSDQPLSGGERAALWSWIAVVLLPLLFAALSFAAYWRSDARDDQRRALSREIRAHYHHIAASEYYVSKDNKTLTAEFDFDGPQAAQYTVDIRTFDCSRKAIDLHRVLQLPAGRQRETFVFPGDWHNGIYDPRERKREWDLEVWFYFEVEPQLPPADVARLRDLGSPDGKLEYLDHSMHVPTVPIIPCSAKPPGKPAARGHVG
jgi:hypothetical protein